MFSRFEPLRKKPKIDSSRTYPSQNAVASEQTTPSLHKANFEINDSEENPFQVTLDTGSGNQLPNLPPKSEEWKKQAYQQLLAMSSGLFFLLLNF